MGARHSRVQPSGTANRSAQPSRQQQQQSSSNRSQSTAQSQQRQSQPYSSSSQSQASQQQRQYSAQSGGVDAGRRQAQPQSPPPRQQNQMPPPPSRAPQNNQQQFQYTFSFGDPFVMPSFFAEFFGGDVVRPQQRVAGTGDIFRDLLSTMFSDTMQPQAQPQHEYQHQQHEPWILRPQPAPAATISQEAEELLPVFRYSKDRQEILKQSKENDTCPICFEEFKVDDRIMLLPCSHQFHADCVKPWLEKHQASCPLCRFEMPVDDAAKDADRRRRMEQQFTKEGIVIMSMNLAVERELEKLLNARRIFHQRRNAELLSGEGIREQVATVNLVDTNLMQILFQLDSIEQFKNERVKDQRRQLVRKVQSILSVVDHARQEMREAERQFYARQDAST